MRLLLKIKNGTPPMRKSALRQITDKARDFGPGPLFDKILPLLMERTLEDQERHLLVKVIDRILYKLDDLVRPYVHKILVVIEPLLIDEDYYARVEGREIISNLSKAAGLAHMISTMRPGESRASMLWSCFPETRTRHRPERMSNDDLQISTTPTSTCATRRLEPSRSSRRLSASLRCCPSSRPSAGRKSRGRLATPVSRSSSRSPS